MPRTLQREIHPKDATSPCCGCARYLPEIYSAAHAVGESYRRILVTGGSGGSGLSSRSDDLDSVVEHYTADDFRQLVIAAQTMPTLLRRLRELEDHSECGLVREATP